MKELFSKIIEALISVLPITAIVYIMSLTPWFKLSVTELINFTVGAVLKIIFRKSLAEILSIFYMLLFSLALILTTLGKQDFLPMAFDSGGVTTGPITVPFIMALGVGVSYVLGDRRAKDNSFGLVALFAEMGMAKKAHGIAFSLPVTDTAGLVKIEEPAPTEV